MPKSLYILSQISKSTQLMPIRQNPLVGRIFLYRPILFMFLGMIRPPYPYSFKSGISSGPALSNILPHPSLTSLLHLHGVTPNLYHIWFARGTAAAARLPNILGRAYRTNVRRLRAFFRRPESDFGVSIVGAQTHALFFRHSNALPTFTLSSLRIAFFDSRLPASVTYHQQPPNDHGPKQYYERLHCCPALRLPVSGRMGSSVYRV